MTGVGKCARIVSLGLPGTPQESPESPPHHGISALVSTLVSVHYTGGISGYLLVSLKESNFLAGNFCQPTVFAIGSHPWLGHLSGTENKIVKSLKII